MHFFYTLYIVYIHFGHTYIKPHINRGEIDLIYYCAVSKLHRKHYKLVILEW